MLVGRVKHSDGLSSAMEKIARRVLRQVEERKEWKLR